MTNQKKSISIHWFRRDLRLDDNAALFLALKSGHPVLPVFIFDKKILEALPEKRDARVLFIHRTLLSLKEELEVMGSTLKIYFDTPEQAWKKITSEYEVAAVYTNRDYEPYAVERDTTIQDFLQKKGIEFNTAKDHVIFEKDEVIKDDGKPYTVYTPYSRKWKSLITRDHLKPFHCEPHHNQLMRHAPAHMFSLEEIGFENFQFEHLPARIIRKKIIATYDQTRDIPSIHGTSRLSLHLRFGTVSIRQLCSIGFELNEKWLNELIWRDFYQMIIHHFPHTVTESFKPAYDRIEWKNDTSLFEKWCNGVTGYPLVDAGMRELNNTGFMHNRVRMVVASFLTKHLLIDWRWGEQYFAGKLLDYELASNVGGWQWAAGCGCDAAPYFRIFNPASQAEKFDPRNEYIRTWIPEINGPDYPKPIVDHKMARERCLAEFKKALSE